MSGCRSKLSFDDVKNIVEGARKELDEFKGNFPSEPISQMKYDNAANRLREGTRILKIMIDGNLTRYP